MKKSLMMLGAAAMVLASCTQNEVMEVAENRAIKFDNAFVGNVTKADIANDKSFTKFYVFGDAKLTAGGEYHNVFTNDEVTGTWTSGAPSTATWTAKEAYWEASSTYKFAAYSDGNNKHDKVTYSPTDGSEVLTFTDYTAGDNDLVAAINNTITTTDNVTSQSAVSLTFDHLLSKVQFTMQTTAGVEYTVKVNSIKFSAIQTTDATYNGTVTWTTADKAAAEYSYNVTGMEDITGGAKTSVKYVIPQSCASITATIALTISGPGIPADKQDNTVTASMGFSKGNGAGTDNIWEPGFSYNYIAVIEPAKIIDGLKVIEFKVDAVDGWTETTDQTPTINKQ